IQESLARLRAVTAEDVRSLAADLYAQPRHLTVVGPFEEDIAAASLPPAEHVEGRAVRTATLAGMSEAAAASSIRVAVLGAAGRMGATVCQAVQDAEGMDLVARLDLGDDVASLAGAADVAVDFTVPSATEANVHALIDAGVHAVVGTTGWQDAALERVREHRDRDG